MEDNENGFYGDIQSHCRLQGTRETKIMDNNANCGTDKRKTNNEIQRSSKMQNLEGRSTKTGTPRQVKAIGRFVQ